MTPHYRLLMSLYQAFNKRNLADALATLHPEVDWPNRWEGGRALGRQNVHAHWMRQWNTFIPDVEPVGFDTDDKGRTIVRVHEVMRDLEGEILEKQFVEHIYEIHDGLITRMDI